MNAHTLKLVLVDELGAKAEGDVISVPSERKVTIIARYGDQFVPVARVSGVRIAATFINIVGDAEELFVDADCEFIVKSEDSRKRDDVRPGFH